MVITFTCSLCGENVPQEGETGLEAHLAHHKEMTQKPHQFNERAYEPRPYHPDEFDGYEDYRAYAAMESSYSYCGECGGRPEDKLHDQTFIEYPSTGSTYHDEAYGVYRYGNYENSSVLAGQQKRSFLGQYETLEEAQIAHPEAIWTDSSNYQEPYIPDEPPAWFDSSIAGESWDGE